jgi:competence protein ComEA
MTLIAAKKISSSLSRCAFLAVVLALFGAGAWAQLPEGPGKETTQRVCKNCHELERAIAPRQGREAWQETLDKMVSVGAEMTEDEYSAILEYLVKNYPGVEQLKLNVNKATAIELESRLTLPRSQATAIIDYRTKHGDFKSIEELKKVPGVDAAKIEAKKDRLTF